MGPVVGGTTLAGSTGGSTGGAPTATTGVYECGVEPGTVCIPEGEFQRGGYGLDTFYPYRTIWISAFEIEIEEV